MSKTGFSDQLRNIVILYTCNCMGYIGQGHQVKVCSKRVCEGHLLCKVSHLQLSLMQKKKTLT